MALRWELLQIFRIFVKRNFKSRTEIWQDAADTSGINKKSTVAGVSWVDQSIGAIYDFLRKWCVGRYDHHCVVRQRLCKKHIVRMGANDDACTLSERNISPSTVVDEPVTNLDIVPDSRFYWCSRYVIRFLSKHHPLTHTKEYVETDGLSWKSLAMEKQRHWNEKRLRSSSIMMSVC